MTLPSFHQPYSHRTRFKVVRSTTRLIQISKTKSTPVTLIRNVANHQSIIKPKLSAVKNINDKYKWIRNSLKKTDGNSFKLDRRKLTTSIVTTSRVMKRKPRASLSKCLVQIRGVKFHRHPNGKCLQRLASDSDNNKILPIKKVEHPTRTRANLLVQRSIQISNGRFRLRNDKKKSLTMKKNCIYFNRFGKCHRGEKCPFIHDRSRIAVCTQFLNGRCKNSSCPYSHELSPGKVPTCSYFIKGACGQDNCPYAHSYVGHDAQTCEDFVQGYCAKGTECAKKHVFLCPDFEAKGQCSRGKQCHLTHRRKRNENELIKKKIDHSKIQPTISARVDIMPAYIPLSQDKEKKSMHTELKLKPSFLS